VPQLRLAGGEISMTKELHGLCQSGQTVEVTGTYEVIGVERTVGPNERETTRDTFHAGEFFPNYDGRAVCWYLSDPIADEHGTPSSVEALMSSNTRIN
jgi:hypothetical protein